MGQRQLQLRGLDLRNVVWSKFLKLRAIIALVKFELTLEIKVLGLRCVLQIACDRIDGV